MGRERHQRTVDAQASAQPVVIGAIVIHGLHDALFRLLPQGVALVEGAQPLFGEVVEEVVGQAFSGTGEETIPEDSDLRSGTRGRGPE